VVAATAPLRPSKRVGRLIKEEGQGMAGVLPSGSCLPPGTRRTVVTLSRLRGYIRVRMHRARVRCHDGISTAGMYHYTHTCVFVSGHGIIRSAPPGRCR